MGCGAANIKGEARAVKSEEVELPCYWIVGVTHCCKFGVNCEDLALVDLNRVALSRAFTEDCADVEHSFPAVEAVWVDVRNLVKFVDVWNVRALCPAYWAGDSAASIVFKAAGFRVKHHLNKVDIPVFVDVLGGCPGSGGSDNLANY